MRNTDNNQQFEVSGSTVKTYKSLLAYAFIQRPKPTPLSFAVPADSNPFEYDAVELVKAICKDTIW